MSKPVLGLFSLTLLFLTLGVGVSASVELPARAAGHATSWILVCLETGLEEKLPDGSFLLETGRPGVDAAIRDRGIHRIDSALHVSSATASKESFRRSPLSRTYRFHLPASADVLAEVERFSKLPGVEYAEPDFVGTGSGFPNDPFFGSQYGFNQGSDADVDGPEGWDVATGEGVIIAVLDTGADSNHPDLAAKLVPGYDFVNGDSDPEDDHGHGTNVSSITSAVTNNGVGAAGSCWNCKIMPLKVLDASNLGNYSWWASAMIYAADNGARVINISAGGLSSSPTLLNGVQYAWDAGVVDVSITHNDDLPSIRYPGRYAETFAVGGTDQFDQRADPFCYSASSGSNWGPEIDFVAPGELILGASMGGGYGSWCGTSQAAPLVAGLVGIMESVYPSVGREEARYLISSGADDEVGRPTEDTRGFDLYHGWGRVNMDRTLQATASAISLRVDGKTATRPHLDTANPVALRYDFIRGDLGALSEAASGVGLGTVVCLENDSLDPDTVGNEDAGIPAAGQGFFYLSRFKFRPALGRSSYGGSSQNRDRTAGAGDCAL